eukprot:m.54291 g.54291  ORF g.54291 m.54291 type:complete len:567 (+) comp15500_c0_seq3:71-1771(+)
MSDNAGIIEECLERVSHPDAIMEADVLSVLGRYVAAGGPPQRMIQCLASSYRGYAQMSNLLRDWLVLSGEDSRTVSQSIEQHIYSVAHDNFDSGRAQKIFDDDQAAPWLTELIKHPTWRALIYQLAQEHPHSLMLSFAIKRISDAGYHDEIARVTMVTQQLEVFSAVLAHVVSALARLSEEELDKALPDLVNMCCAGQHTYIYAHALLRAATRLPHAQHLKRLSQELVTHATKDGKDVLQYSLLFDVDSSSSAASAPLAAALSSMLKSGALNSADILRIYELYGPENDDKPSVDLLRIPSLFELFLKALFSPNKSVSAEQRDRYCYVLAYAVSVQETTEESGTVTVDYSELADTTTAISKAVEIVSEGSLHTSAVAVLYEVMKYPVVSRGILHWLDKLIQDEEFFSTYNGTNAPPHLSLIDHIAQSQRLLQPCVFEVLAARFQQPFHVDPLMAIEIRKLFIGHILFLMSLGFVLPVLRYMKQAAGDVDLTLSMHFVSEVMGMVAPPFSVDFIRAFSEILFQRDVLAGFLKKSSSHDVLRRFVRDAERTQGLSEELRAQFQSIGREL